MKIIPTYTKSPFHFFSDSTNEQQSQQLKSKGLYVLYKVIWNMTACNSLKKSWSYKENDSVPHTDEDSEDEESPISFAG